MHIGDEELEKYMKLYEEEFKEKISREEAYEQFLNVLNVLLVIYFPSKK